MIAALVIQLDGFLRPMRPVHGRLVKVKNISGPQLAKALGDVFGPRGRRSFPGDEAYAPLWGQHFTFISTELESFNNMNAAANIFSKLSSFCAANSGRAVSKAKCLKEVYVSKAIRNLFAEPEESSGLEGYFFIQHRRVIAAIINGQTFTDKRAVIDVNLFANSKGIFSLAVVGLSLIPFFLIYWLDVRVLISAPSIIKHIDPRLAFWVLSLLLSLTFWLSLGWLNADHSWRGLRSAITTLNWSANWSMPISQDDSDLDRLPYARLAQAVLWSLLLAAGLAVFNRLVF